MPKQPITWYINDNGNLFIIQNTHNLDDSEEEIDYLCSHPTTRIITEDNKIHEFFASLGYRPTLDDNNNILYYFMCDEWGNDSI